MPTFGEKNSIVIPQKPVAMGRLSPEAFNEFPVSQAGGGNTGDNHWQLP